MSHIDILINNFPMLSETFILRQARKLNACVTAGKIDRQMLLEKNFHNSVMEIGGRGFRPTLPQKVLNRVSKRQSSKLSGKPLKDLHTHWNRKKPKIILAEFGPNGIRANQVCPDLGIPFVIHFHGYDASSLLRSLTYRREISEALENASAAIVVSNVMKKTIVKLGFPEHKIAVIPVGAPVREFPSKKTNASNREIFEFLCVGRLTEKKSPLETLKAFKKSHSVCPQTKLTVIGQGPLLQQINEFVKTAKLEAHVDLLGGMPFSTVKRRLMDADCFLQHSITAKNGDQEGWPTVIAEAMAASLPVISTNHAGIIEQIDHGVTGFRVDEHDVENMAKYMIQLAQTPSLAEEMGFAGRKRIEKIGDAQEMIHRLRQLLDQHCL